MSVPTLIRQPATSKKRRGESPPRRFRHQWTIYLSATTAILFLLLSCLDGSPGATLHLGTGFGFSAPHRWYLNVPGLLALLTLAIAGWLPSFQEPTMDWQAEKRSRKLRDLIEEEVTYDHNLITGEVIKREKTLAEMSLERALAQAEAELQVERKRNGQQPPSADSNTISQSQIQIAMAATLNTSPPAERPAIRAFTQRLHNVLTAQSERDQAS